MQEQDNGFGGEGEDIAVSTAVVVSDDINLLGNSKQSNASAVNKLMEASQKVELSVNEEHTSCKMIERRSHNQTNTKD